MSRHTHPATAGASAARSILPDPVAATTAAFGPPQTDAAGFSATLNTDPHLIDKIGTCPTVEELDAMREAIRARGETLPDGAAYAFTERRKRLDRGGNNGSKRNAL